MKKRLLIFHSALAPYRVDFFNALGSKYDCTIIFLTKNNANQNFNQDHLLKNATFKYEYLDIHFIVFHRNVNVGYWRKIKQHNPDIIIANEFGLPLIASYIYKKITNSKFQLYTMCDDSIPICNNCKGIRLYSRNFFCKHINGIITANKEVSSWYLTNTAIKRVCDFPIIRNEELYKKYLHLSIPIAQKYLVKWNLTGKSIIIFVGRLTRIKNLLALLRIYASIKQNKQNSILIIIGSGEQNEYLKSEAINLGITDNIIFAGRYEGNELLAWYNIADFLILPSLHEAFGAVTAEALMAGCRAMVSSFAGSNILVNKKNGIIFNPKEKKDFTNALEYMIDSSQPTYKAVYRDSLLSITFKEKINELIKFL